MREIMDFDKSRIKRLTYFSYCSRTCIINTRDTFWDAFLKNKPLSEHLCVDISPLRSLKPDYPVCRGPTHRTPSRSNPCWDISQIQCCYNQTCIESQNLSGSGRGTSSIQKAVSNTNRSPSNNHRRAGT